jgi:hypothetical protein
MRVTLARTLLLLAAPANLLLALSMPATGEMTLSQQVNQVAFVMGMVLCAVAFIQLVRRPEGARRLALGGGVLGLVMIVLDGWSLLALMRAGGGGYALSALVPLATWAAMIVAAGCVVGRPTASSPLGAPTPPA